jgi:hypothetical protein
MRCCLVLQVLPNEVVVRSVVPVGLEGAAHEFLDFPSNQQVFLPVRGSTAAAGCCEVSNACICSAVRSIMGSSCAAILEEGAMLKT